MAAIQQLDSDWSDGLIEIYRDHYDQLVQMARRTVRCHALAEEVVHDAFVTYHSRGCRPADGREVSYLRSMVMNRGRSVVRRTIRREELTVPDVLGDPGPEETCLALMDAERVREAVADLPGRQQQVLSLRYQHGLSEREIAEALGITSGSVKVHAARGREALRTELLPMI